MTLAGARGRPPGACAARHSTNSRGFTLIELLMVLALLAVAAGLATLALRDGSSNRLEQEGERLAALLEAARAEARASGLAVHWHPMPGNSEANFRFAGLPTGLNLPNRWLDANVHADVAGAASVPLGPEPVIGPQRIVLRLGNERLDVHTDGLAPFRAGAGSAP